MTEVNNNKQKFIDAKYLEHYPIVIENIPFNWSAVYIEDIILNVQPGFASGEHNQNGVGIPHIRPMNINRVGNINLSEIKYVSFDKSNLRLNKGNVLFNNTNSPALIGKTAAIQNDNDWGFSNHMTRLTLYPEVNYKFISYQLHYFWMCGYYQNRCVHHVNQASISSKVLVKTVPVVVPSSNEQTRIVEKIEELFSDLDQGIENLKKAQKQLKVYRQVVLKWAFEGKLTEKWRSQVQQKKLDIKTGEELLAQIKAERESRYQQQLVEWEEAVREWEAIGKIGKKPNKPSKLKDVLSLTKTELAEFPQLPDDWRWVKLGSISTNIQIGPFGSLLHKSDYVLNQIPAINPSHIKNLTIIPDFNQTITPEKASALANYVLTKGDIIMGRRGEMGRCAVVTEKEDKYLCGTGSLFIRLIDQLNSFFYCFILSSRRVKTHLENSSIGTTMQNLNEDILHDIPVPLCNPVEQDKILEEIESRFSICDQLEATIIENLQKAEALRQSILKQAFEGKLVPQDPNDEPAEKLLERIKQEKFKVKKDEQLSIQGV